MPRKQPPEKRNEDPDYQLMARINNELHSKWLELSRSTTIDPVKFTQISSVATLHLAAVLAIDVGSKPDQFLAMAKAAFDAAYAAAPKFG